MGDRCYFQITMSQRHTATWMDIVYGAAYHRPSPDEIADEFELHPDGTATWTDEEMNYGGTASCCELAERNASFIGFTGNGLGYDATRFCGHAGEFSMRSWGEYGPQMHVLLSKSSVKIDENDKKDLQRFIARYRRAQIALGLEDTGGLERAVTEAAQQSSADTA